MPADSASPTPHRRRPRYAGKNPRKFSEKYKEQNPEKYPETIAKVLASGKTPAGMHVPIMVAEILEQLNPQPGQHFVDATLGYGGHAAAILARLQPGGVLLGLDLDSVEQPKTEARLRAQGYDAETFRVQRGNYAGLTQAIVAQGWTGVDGVLADLGVSSMQLDTPERGFSIKHVGPLDMRMNPAQGQPASVWLEKITTTELVEVLTENADEPRAELLAPLLAGRLFAQTTDLRDAIHRALPRGREEEIELTVRRVFQAVRIAVNGEFSALEALLRQLPDCLKPGGCVAILTFHSGEDRRVKKSFQAGLHSGRYASIADNVLLPSAMECRNNPRASSAKLRWARVP